MHETRINVLLWYTNIAQILCVHSFSHFDITGKTVHRLIDITFKKDKNGSVEQNTKLLKNTLPFIQVTRSMLYITIKIATLTHFYVFSIMILLLAISIKASIAGPTATVFQFLLSYYFKSFSDDIVIQNCDNGMLYEISS